MESYFKRSRGTVGQAMIIWLASYPKSGSTWLRIILANYLANANRPLQISEGIGLTISESQVPLYESKGWTAFAKTHKSYNFDIHGTRPALYVVRNPEDVSVSLANHKGISLDDAVDRVCSRWAEHTDSWWPNAHFVYYEAMHATPHAELSKVLTYLGHLPDYNRMTKAIEFSSFEELKQQEQKAGFIEKSEHSERFFRKGTIGEGFRTLNQDQINKIRSLTDGTLYG